MSKNILFISDLHLAPAEPKSAALFIKFLHEIAPTTSALYILGDLFKFWIGDDDRSEFNQSIIIELKKLSTSVPIYLMPGNRDFLLSNNFATQSGCQLIPDPHTIDLFGTPTLLTHGDILCTKDIKHIIFRAIIRFHLGLKLFLLLPLKIRNWMACTIQKYSTKSKKLKSKYSLAPQQITINKLITKHQARLIIHGHTHYIEDVTFTVNGSKIQRVALGEWSDHGDYLLWHEDGAYKLEIFS
jgi:UDP-2,3-diacylglucosamine hydrolase